MSDEHDRPGYSVHGPSGEDGTGSVSVTDERQAARWGTLELSLPEDAVRERIRAALLPRQPFAYGAVVSGSESRRGFLLRFRAKSRVLAGEVELAAWEGGTQVHVAVPAEQKPRDFEVLMKWLRGVFAGFMPVR